VHFIACEEWNFFFFSPEVTYSLALKPPRVQLHSGASQWWLKKEIKEAIVTDFERFSASCL